MKKLCILFICVLLNSSCTILPSHEYRAVEYCRKEAYDTVCPGYDANYPHYYRNYGKYD